MNDWKAFCIFLILKIVIIHAEVIESNNFLGKTIQQTFQDFPIINESYQSPQDLNSLIDDLKKSPLMQDIQFPTPQSPILSNDQNQMPLPLEDILKSTLPLNLLKNHSIHNRPLPHAHVGVPDPDWADLARYAASDAELSKLPAGSNQVVFMGDSITDRWNISHWFPNKPYVNRGIGGQNTPRMLVRFREDVINLQPNVTIILGGTNDIYAEMNLTTIQANLATMVELSQFHGFIPIIASVTPVCGPVVADHPPQIINSLNAWIQNFCKQTGIIYLDYFSSLVGSDGLLKQDLTDDCIHPNAAGYDLMAPLAQAAIDQALLGL